MQVALIGEPLSGKTTLFSTLTGIDYSRVVCGGKKITASIRIEDPRLFTIHEKVGKDKKLVCPTMELVDTQPLLLDGIDKDKSRELFSSIREADGFIGVIKLYDTTNINQKLNNDIKSIQSELFLSDLDLIEKRLEKLKTQKKRPAQFKEDDERELELLEYLLKELPNGKREILQELKLEDKKRLAGFQLFSQKPIIYIANVSDQDLAKAVYEQTINDKIVFCIPAKLELELSEMPQEERQPFMESYGLKELSIKKLPLKIYHNMGYKIFFTIGKNEVAGWVVRQEADALESAGKIHTDMARGFISAEVASFEDWLKSIRPRMEGKAYKVQDGDVIYFRFNV